MDVSLTIRYHTKWGDQLYIKGNFNHDNEEILLPLSFTADGDWHRDISVAQGRLIKYHYILVCAEGKEIIEPIVREFLLTNKKPLEIKDQWLSPENEENILYNSVFQNAVFKRTYKTNNQNTLNKDLHFSISIPQVTADQKICVSGNIPELGNWNIYTPLLLNTSKFALWSAGFNFEHSECNSFEYKYAIYDTKKKCITEWEQGPNRVAMPHPHKTNLLGDALFRHSHKWKGAGIALPVFSLRSKKGMGIGEFSDIKLLGDLIKPMGMQIIQILPINDTISKFNWTDSYPYNAISVYALNPIYIHLDDLFKHDQQSLNTLQTERDALNKKTEVDFDYILKLKFSFLHKAFKYHKASLSSDPDFHSFVDKNNFWLKPYALFCYLRDRFKTTNFSQWGKYSTFKNIKLDELYSSKHKHYDKLLFYIFIQYQLDKQLSESVAYIHNNGIALKGDIPIGISRESVDAWTTPELFNFDQQTGAPPDYFSTVGQNWGFPTYNWDMMAKDGYEWWNNRFLKMADYFDAYRIDHILGFFRIWEIHQNYEEGLMGHFTPALPYTKEELLTHGIPFDKKWWCTPHISEQEASDFFGHDKTLVINTFFDKDENLYYLKSDKQFTRNLETRCRKTGINSQKTIDALREVICDVLFMEDSKYKEQFHPRIELFRTRKFKALDDGVQHRLSELYFDFFFKRHNSFWEKQALKKLPAIVNNSNMMACGEDLGMIPENVPNVMNDLRILTLNIQSMPKNQGVEFEDPRSFNYFSVCTTSTHDTPTLRGMWKYDPDKGNRLIASFCNEHVGYHVECPGWLCRKILEVNLQAGSILTILPFQDWLAIDDNLRHPDPHAERINKPEISRHYWRYRIHTYLEELMLSNSLSKDINRLISNNRPA